MKFKRFAIFTLAITMIAMLTGAVVSAQDDDTTSRKRGGFGRGFKGQSTVILEATGLTHEELREALQDGSTMADLITANGGDVDAVIAQLVEEATTHINEHVEDGRLTQEQADERLATLEDNITERINGTFEPPADGDGFRGRRGRRGFRGDAPTDDATETTETDAGSEDL